VSMRTRTGLRLRLCLTPIGIARTAQGKSVARRRRKARVSARGDPQPPDSRFCPTRGRVTRMLPHMPTLPPSNLPPACGRARRERQHGARRISSGVSPTHTIDADATRDDALTAAHRTQNAPPTLLQPFASWKDSRPLRILSSPTGDFNGPVRAAAGQLRGSCATDPRLTAPVADRGRGRQPVLDLAQRVAVAVSPDDVARGTSTIRLTRARFSARVVRRRRRLPSFRHCTTPWDDRRQGSRGFPRSQ
jgi:hypothetical protein